ncbi:MAG TPA: xanthine dehydrogenase family protein molybdopterin-binding subunit [Gammaproteobacteria bacterium]|nr:xanthine dehydrogenase family protein molybdopterin-binding subunit [Gammaproteobacteria bacterium]
MAYELLGKNFVPPDVHAKVTGKAKYAEDFRAEGMAFCRLMLSPMPHARVRSIDTKAAEALPGVLGILTANDVPLQPSPNDPILTNEPVFVGQPILAVAAESETIAQDAIDLIKLDLEELPFTVDPLESLYPGGPNARSDGNVLDNRLTGPPSLKTVKWNAADFARAEDGTLPMGEPIAEWSYGDVDAAFKNAKLVLDETFVTAGNSHQSMEPRSAMSYWENGKCFVFGSTQSQSFVVPGLAGLIGIDPSNLVYVAEFCGGGFGSKGSAYPIMSIPAHMSKKIGRPVMMRISRAEEYYLGFARCGFQGRIKMAFDASGRVLGADLYVVQENGPTAGFPDWPSAGDTVSILYQPPAMRYRGTNVLTNTPPRSAQRGPGHNQTVATVEPLMDKAARALGIDRWQIRRINAPGQDGKLGQNRGPVTSCYLQQALEKGAAEFKWQERVARAAAANADPASKKRTGIGVGQAFHPAGFAGFDGICRITPDGKIHLHSGVGNLGTYSHTGTSRVAAEVLKANWDNCVVERGDTRKGLPWNIGQFGSNTSFTMARSSFAAATATVALLKEIAAMDLGGAPNDYEIGGEKVFLRTDPSKSLTYAAAAQRAIALGGKFDGHEPPKDVNPMTAASVTMLAGTGLVGAAKDNLPITAQPAAFAVGFAEIELDTETGKFEVKDYLAVADCGTVIHPQSLATQIKGGAVMGFGMATLERQIYDPQNGLPGNVGLHQTKPPSYLDVPSEMHAAWVDMPDPQSPLGTKGIGEPVLGAGAASLLCALSDAMGGHNFNRTPVTPDQIVNALMKREQSHKPLQVNTA